MASFLSFSPSPHLTATLGLLAMFPCLALSQIPRDSRQAIVGISKNWDDSHVTLQRFARAGGQWRPVGTPWPGRLGKAGLAWGRGVTSGPPPEGISAKKEGDGKAPAGIFLLGGAYGLVAPDDLPRHRDLPYTKVSPRHLWIEDPASPHYNRHLVLEAPEPTTAWERKQQMKLNDPAHALKLLIRHNTDPQPIAGAGSAIFFHIWRENGKRATTGCTTMQEAKLREVIAWLDPGAQPVYVLLPRESYDLFRRSWHLP